MSLNRTRRNSRCPERCRISFPSEPYNKAIERLNAGNAKRFPVRAEFYEAMDEAFDPSTPMYRNDFEQFLDNTYGVNPNPFENEDFEW